MVTCRWPNIRCYHSKGILCKIYLRLPQILRVIHLHWVKLLSSVCLFILSYPSSLFYRPQHLRIEFPKNHKVRIQWRLGLLLKHTILKSYNRLLRLDLLELLFTQEPIWQIVGAILEQNTLLLNLQLHQFAHLIRRIRLDVHCFWGVQEVYARVLLHNLASVNRVVKANLRCFLKPAANIRKCIEILKQVFLTNFFEIIIIEHSSILVAIEFWPRTHCWSFIWPLVKVGFWIWARGNFNLFAGATRVSFWTLWAT